MQRADQPKLAYVRAWRAAAPGPSDMLKRPVVLRAVDVMQDVCDSNRCAILASALPLPPAHASEGCERSGASRCTQWDFHLAVAPIRFAGTSGNPVNPIATF
jgi:hypothetical protein